MAWAHGRAAVSLKLPPLADLQGVHQAATRIRVALAANHLENDRARILLSLMPVIAGCLHFEARQRA